MDEKKDWKEVKNVAEHNVERSDLTLDINATEGLRFGGFDRLPGFGCQQADSGVSLLEQFFASMITNEGAAKFLGVKRQFFADKGQWSVLSVAVLGVSDGFILPCDRVGTHVLQMPARAARRSRSTNISIK